VLARLHQALPEAAELAVARARLLEWRLRRYADALELVELALAAAAGGLRLQADLLRRRERLLRRRSR
jgi:hypothetical protein